MTINKGKFVGPAENEVWIQFDTDREAELFHHFLESDELQASLRKYFFANKQTNFEGEF